ncbi:hypothetical protein EDD17DRAFT_786815 [Pisolithus thermaeus]|nr:hypothetical protein EDD17DRAFT_786815 [Pisolithus thermaeus]
MLRVSVFVIFLFFSLWAFSIPTQPAPCNPLPPTVCCFQCASTCSVSADLYSPLCFCICLRIPTSRKTFHL